MRWPKNFSVSDRRFYVAGVFDIADTTSYLSFYGSVDPSVYANVTALGGAGQLVAVIDSDFTNIYGVVPEPATLAILGLVGLGLLRRKR